MDIYEGWDEETKRRVAEENASCRRRIREQMDREALEHASFQGEMAYSEEHERQFGSEVTSLADALMRAYPETAEKLLATYKGRLAYLEENGWDFTNGADQLRAEIRKLEGLVSR